MDDPRYSKASSGSEWELSALKGRRFSAVARPEELLQEIEVLHDELERSNRRLQTSDTALEQLRKQLKEQDDGVVNRTTPLQRPTGFYEDGATEVEIRWGCFLSEKLRLQSEKGWRKALKESKKILHEQLEESRTQRKARDIELANLRSRLGDDHQEVQKQRSVVKDLQDKLNEAKEALASDRKMLMQEREKNSQLEEEFAFVHFTKESGKLSCETTATDRSKRRLVTNDLASQLHLDDDDFDEYDRQEHRNSSEMQKDASMIGLRCIQEEEKEEKEKDEEEDEEKEASHSHPSLRTSVKRPDEPQHHAHQLVRPSIQQQQRHSRQSFRRSVFLQREEELQRRLHASEAACRELEAQLQEFQHRPQPMEHAVLAPSTLSPQVPDPELSGANNELWGECEELRNELAKAKKDAMSEARDIQRRLLASEAQCQELQIQVSDMQCQAQLAEKQFRDWQNQVSAPWWSKLACHCMHKRPGEGGEQSAASAVDAATPATEEKLQLSRQPRAAIHMKAAKHTGASWLAKPLG